MVESTNEWVFNEMVFFFFQIFSRTISLFFSLVGDLSVEGLSQIMIVPSLPFLLW